MSRRREAEFTAELWRKFHEYLKNYDIAGCRLEAKPPDSVSFCGKIPDIVVVDSKNVPQLITETKRKAEGLPKEKFLNPLNPR